MNFNKYTAGSFLLLSFIAGSASGRSEKASTNSSRAILTIQVNVAPVAVLPRADLRRCF